MNTQEKREIIEQTLTNAFIIKVATLEAIDAIEIDPNAFWAISVNDGYEEHYMLQKLSDIETVLTEDYGYTFGDFQELVKQAYENNRD